MLLDQIKGQVFVYNMAKVASVAIHNALTNKGLQVHHFHALDEDYLEHVLSRSDIIHHTVEKMHQNALRRKLVVEGYGRYVKLIVPFRDPVARWVSQVHFMMHYVPPAIGGENIQKTVDQVVGELNGIVERAMEYQHVDYDAVVAEIKRLRHTADDIETPQISMLNQVLNVKLSTCWFETELRRQIGIDILQGIKFPESAATYPYKNALLVKTEKLNTDEAADDIRRFVQLNSLDISRVNTGDEHGDKAIYDAVKRTKFPNEFLDTFYQSPWIKHLYSDEEIERFYEKWSLS